MALFENFPYTNLHELNLDWIIETLKSVNADYESVKNFIPMIPEINEKLDELDNLPEEFAAYKAEINLWKAQVTAQMDQLEQLIDSYTTPLSNIICLTDSYGLDSESNNRLSWCTQLRDKLGLTDNVNYRKIFVSGGSFGNSDPTKNLYAAFVTGTQAMTEAQKNAVTDIVIEEGVNEWMQDNTTMIGYMTDLNTHIRANFPNAKIHLFACGWDLVPEIRYALMGSANGVYNVFKETCANLKWHCVINISAMLSRQNYWDTVHPTIQGSREIANIIYNDIINHETYIYNKNVRSELKVVTDNNTRTLGYIEFDGCNYLLSTVTVGLDHCPAIPSGFNGECKLGEILTDAVIGYDGSVTPAPASPLCKLGLYINNTWEQHEGRLLFKYETGDKMNLYFRNNGDFSVIPTPGTSVAAGNSYIATSPIIIPVWD